MNLAGDVTFSPALLAVDVKDLHYHYSDGTEALRWVSFQIAQGECVGLIGPNGAGKSTLLLHLNGILPDAPDAGGSVTILGKQVRRENIADIRRTVGLLFQDPDDQLFCPTIFDDVAFGPQQFGVRGDALAGLVRESLTSVGLTGFEKRSPQRLSGGEKKRACLAGILACKPEVLVLDEPTAGLDPRGRREFKALLRSLPGTKLIATHDLELVADLCSRTLVMDDGRIVAHGKTIDLLSNDELMLAHGLERPRFLHAGLGAAGDDPDVSRTVMTVRETSGSSPAAPSPA